MSEENVVRLCAPTLAGIKTGSLFPCPFENRETLLMEIRQYNQVLVPKGLCLLPLRFTDKSALLYLCLLYTSSKTKGNFSGYAGDGAASGHGAHGLSSR